MMAQPLSPYQYVIVETFKSSRKGDANYIHARPVDGQGFPSWTEVECSKAMRLSHPVGTRIKVRAKQTDREGGSPFLYTHFSWPYEVIE